MSQAAALAADLAADLGALSNLIYEENRAKGFWPENHAAGQEECLQPIEVWDGEEIHQAKAMLPPRNVGEQLMLVVTEISEALETFRKNGFIGESNVLPGTAHFSEEIADAIIRLLDLDGGFNLGVWYALAKKLKYNASRPPKHGKKF